MRKGNPTKRDVLPDPIYNSKLVTRLINKLMLDGKRAQRKIFSTALSKRSKKKLANQQWTSSLQRSTTSCQKSNLR